jgi:hypothetical protein
MLVERKEHKEENGNIGYIESVFHSDNVLKTTYFPKIQRLYIAFSRGHTYSYGNISPELYAEFEEAESQGVFFYKKINNKATLPARKEFTLYPEEVKDLREIIKERLNKIETDDDE